MEQPELLLHSVSPMWSKLFFVNYLSVLVDIGITKAFVDVRIIQTFVLRMLCLFLLVRCTHRYLQTSVFPILFSSV